MRSLAPLGLLLVCCGPPVLEAVPLDCPAPQGSRLPDLAAGPGGARMTWVETNGEAGHRLRLSALETDGWSAPRTAAAGGNWFVNWADFPSVAVVDRRTLAVHWLERSGKATYAYGVRLAVSSDRGKTWSPPITPHRDATPTEHGFVSLVPLEDGAILTVWLDGRETGGPDAGAMTLRAATLSPGGVLGAEELVDPRVCDCCATDAVRLEDGSVVVAYRDRAEGEVRDIRIAARREDGWHDMGTVHDDGWEIAGCPVNGPAIAAMSDRVAVAWFTAAGDRPRVLLAESADGGASFGAPIRLDGGVPLGRVALAATDDRYVAMWLERGGEGEARVMAREVDRRGRAGAPLAVASTGASRESGVPRLAVAEAGILAAWTDTVGDAPRVKTALLRVSR